MTAGKKGGSELIELVRVGRIPIGTVLHHPARRYPARQVEAVVEASGIRVGKQLFSSPTGAAESIARVSTNGWTFWRVKGTNETLAAVREGRGS